MGQESRGNRQNITWYSVLLLVTVISIAVIFRRAFQQPFVQDDWVILYHIRTTPVSKVIAQAFNPPEGLIFFRPLGMLYFLLMYRLFGLHLLPYHLVALILFIADLTIVALIVKEITRRDLLAFSVAALFAVATTVYGDTILWMVGFYDLAGALFFFLTILFFLRGRPVFSGLAFFLGLLTKESCVPVFIILVIHALVFDRKRLRLLLLHSVVFAAYISARFLTVDFLSLGRSNPYGLTSHVIGIVNNIILYSDWALQVIIPYASVSYRFLQVRSYTEIVALLVGVLVFVIILRKRPPDKVKLRQSVFLFSWMALGVAPVLLLKDHPFRYYLIYSLPPFITLVIFYAETIVPRYFRRYAGIALVIFIVWNAAENCVYFDRQFNPGEMRYVYGTNNLVWKGHTVQTAETQMLRRYTSLPRGSRLVLSGINTKPFCDELGPRLWYGDTTLQVLTLTAYDELSARARAGNKHTFFLVFHNVR